MKCMRLRTADQGHINICIAPANTFDRSKSSYRYMAENYTYSNQNNAGSLQNPSRSLSFSKCFSLQMSKQNISKNRYSYEQKQKQSKQQQQRDKFLHQLDFKAQHEQQPMLSTPQKDFRQFRLIRNLNEIRTTQTVSNESTVKSEEESFIIFQASHHLNLNLDDKKQRISQVNTQTGSHISKANSLFSVDRKISLKWSSQYQNEEIISLQRHCNLIFGVHRKSNVLLSLYRCDLKFNQTEKNSHFISIWRKIKHNAKSIYVTSSFNYTLQHMISNNLINQANIGLQIVKIAKILTELYFSGLQIINIREIGKIVAYTKYKVMMLPYFKKVKVTIQSPELKNLMAKRFLQEIKDRMEIIFEAHHSAY